MKPDDYRLPGVLTQLTEAQQVMVAEVGDDPYSLCLAAQHLLVLPRIISGSDTGVERQHERNLRPAGAILGTALQLDDRPLRYPRPLARRVIGTCRHFAVLSCAFLRARGVAARARCGFATYFRPGLALDHWITEYWHDQDARWMRIDTEILGLELGVGVDAADLPTGAFLTGAEAWQQYRDGADPMTFGVDGTENWGAAEIIGNAIRDLATLHKVEMLPWDEWGPMRDCYDGTISSDVEDFMDAVVSAEKRSDSVDTTSLYERFPAPDAL